MRSLITNWITPTLCGEIRHLVISRILILVTLLIVAPTQGWALDIVGERDVKAFYQSSKKSLKKLSRSSRAYTRTSSRVQRLKRAMQPLMAATTAVSGPRLNAAMPASPIVFSKLTPNSNGRYIIKFIGKGFSNDMTLRATFLQSKPRTVIAPFTFVSAEMIEISIYAPFTADVNFTLFKSANRKVLVSNTFMLSFLTTVAAPSPTPSSTPLPSPSSSPSSSPTPAPSTPPITSNPGDHVATLELAANNASKFVLRGVVPVPAQQVLLSGVLGGRSQFAIEDANGSLVPAQMEWVTKEGGRFAGDPDPDIGEVEVIAQVSQKAGQARPRYRVFMATSQQPVRPSSNYTVRSILGAPPFSSQSAVTSLFNAPGKILLRAHDIFGHLYTWDLTEQLEGLPKIIKYGAHQVEMRSFGVMKPDAPVSGSQGTYPRLFNVHAYLSLLKDTKALKLDLKIGNTMAGLNKGVSDDDFLKEFYYRDLYLEITGTGWNLAYNFKDAYAGNAYNQGSKTIIPLITALPSRMHYMPPLKNIKVRAALYPNIAGAQADAQMLAQEGNLSFAVAGQSANNSQLELFSYFNPHLARYLPQGMYVPQVNHLSGGASAVRSSFQGSLSQYSKMLMNDECAVISSTQNGVTTWRCDYPKICGSNPKNPNDSSAHACGPIAAMGVAYGGMTGGSEIIKTEGAFVASAASTEGYRWLLLQEKLRTQRNDQFHLRNGEVVNTNNLLLQTACGATIPVDYFNQLNYSQLDPWGANASPTFQSAYAAANNLRPDYEYFWNPKNSSAFANEDGQHYVRVERTVTASIYLGNDSMAKDDAEALAGIVLMQHPSRPVKCNGTTPVQDSESLQTLRPGSLGNGAYLGREHAHMWMAIVSAYSVASHAWRESVRPMYFDYFVDEILSRAQIPSLGFIVKTNNYSKNSPTGKCLVVPTNEAGFLDVLMTAIMNRVYDGADETHYSRLQSIVTNHVYSNLIPELAWAGGGAPNSPAWHSTRFRVPLSHSSAPNAYFHDWADVPLACQNDSNNMGPSAGEFMLGFQQVREWTGDPAFSQAASKKLNPSSQATLLNKLQAVNFYNLSTGNYTALLACAQRGRC